MCRLQGLLHNVSVVPLLYYFFVMVPVVTGREACLNESLSHNISNIVLSWFANGFCVLLAS